MVLSTPLGLVLCHLSTMVETDSQESLERIARRSKRRTMAMDSSSTSKTPEHPPHPLPISNESTSSSVDRSTTPVETVPRFPTDFQTPDTKRKISQTSFGEQSTETTPVKLVHPETKVQNLQNKFADLIVISLFEMEIPIRWAKGRKMFYDYAESSLSSWSCLLQVKQYLFCIYAAGT